MLFRIAAVFLLLDLCSCTPKYYDVVVYGGTSAGVMAAVQAARMGKSVALISTSRHLGGMTINGLGWVDVGEPTKVGGLANVFFGLVKKYYDNNSVWRAEPKHMVKEQLRVQPSSNMQMWTVEPHVAEQIFSTMINKEDIDVAYSERLNRQTGVLKNGTQIQQIVMESGQIFQGKVFIDASYEGDLMAAAGVSYTVGREANSRYRETLNGVQSKLDTGSGIVQVDPYNVKGDPLSGLLPRVYPNAGGADGSADSGIQAYTYRMCLTDVPANRVRVGKPENYSEKDYEIVFRMMESTLPKFEFYTLNLLPNRKTDSNSYGRVSTDYVGMNWNYIEASYTEREKIAKKHENWQRGLIYTLQNSPRVPEKVRAHYQNWGLAKDEFVDNQNWPYEIYVREGRRMISSVVINENTALGKEVVKDPVAYASYSMDSHAIKYFVNEKGFLTMDGVFFKDLPGPFPISYQALVPKKTECRNLIVPVCLSASHVAFGAIRMEPVFMMLGQVAGTAASLSVDKEVSIQEISYASLKKQLLQDKQAL